MEIVGIRVVDERPGQSTKVWPRSCSWPSTMVIYWINLPLNCLRANSRRSLGDKLGLFQRFTLVFLFTITVLLLKREALAVTLCRSALVGQESASVASGLFSPQDAGVFNYNALQSASTYRQNNRRNKREYFRILGPEFSKLASHLRPSMLYVDSGSGMGVAAWQIAFETQAQVLMINPQDYSYVLSPFYEVLALVQGNGLDPRDVQVKWSDGDLRPQGVRLSKDLVVPLKSLDIAFEIMQLEIPTLIKEPSAIDVLHEKNFLKVALDAIYRVALSDEFSRPPASYRVGLSESILKEFSGRVHLLSDVYSAFYYSPNRLEVLHSYYDALIDGGHAFIFLGAGLDLDSSEGGRRRGMEPYRGDKVNLKNGSPSVSLIQWLVERYPMIFQLHENKSGTGYYLRMFRQQGVEFPALEEKIILTNAGYYNYSDSGFIVPQLEFTEK